MNKLLIVLFTLTITLSWAENSFLNEDPFFKPITTIGGYGEIHYNYEKTDSKREKAELDFHRLVVFFSHAWTSQLSFKAEVEIEHNFIEGGKESGQIAVEQALLRYAFFNNTFATQVGVFLAPISYINQYHEPNLFLSVERPRYASRVIPTTLFENGAGLTYQINPELFVSATILGGFNLHAVNNSSKGLRSARLKGFETNAQSLNYIVSVQWASDFGLLAGGSLSYNRDGDNRDALAEAPTNEVLEAGILEGFVKFENHRFFGIAEGAITLTQQAVIEGGRVHGFYVHGGVNVISCGSHKLFLWGGFDTFQVGIQNRESNIIGGISYLPIKNIVYKADFAMRKIGSVETYLFNLGAGYSF